MPKAILINPPSAQLVERRTLKFHRRFPPLSLLVTAGLLRTKGWSVELVDLNTRPRLAGAGLEQAVEDASLVVLTTNPYADWQCPSLDIAHILKLARSLRGQRLVITGNHGTHYPGAMLRETGAAVVVRNEPEQSTVDVAEAWRTSGSIGGIPGISFRDGDRNRHNGPRALVPLESLPSPAYDLVDLGDYYYELLGQRFALLETSRGCPFSCNFCNLSMFQNRYRKSSVERVLAEIDTLVETHGCRSLYIFDLEFAINRRMVKEVCGHLVRRDYKRRFGFRWCCQTRADSVDPDLLQLMKQSGCDLIHFGVEAGEAGVLARTRKRIKLEQIRAGVRATKRAGIRTAAFFMFGHPGEGPSDFQATLDFALELSPTYASFHALAAFPGSPLFEERYGKGPYWEEPLILNRTYFSPEDEAAIARFIRKAYLRFYLRPQIWPGLLEGHWRDCVGQIRLFCHNVLQS